MRAAFPRNNAEKRHADEDGDAEPEGERGGVEVEQGGRRASVPYDLDHPGGEGKGRWGCRFPDAYEFATGIVRV